MLGSRRLLLFSTGQQGPGTMCGGIRIVAEALNRVSDLCVLAITDCDSVGRLRPDDRFDHIRVPRPEPPGETARALRSVVIDTAMWMFQPDIVLALRSTGADHELLGPLQAERTRRPEVRAVLGLWDLLRASEVEALATMPDVVHEVFDEVWSFGDPMVHDNRPHLTREAAGNLRDCGYVTDGGHRSAGTAMSPPRVTRPWIAIHLGSGWLSSTAVRTLGTALKRPGMRSIPAELVPNEVLGRARAARLAARLGIKVRRPRWARSRQPEPTLLVSTGGYNSVCTALEASVPVAIVHDSTMSTARRRADALADLGLCVSIDLCANEPADVEHSLLDAMAGGRSQRELLTGGGAAATERIVDLLEPPLSDELAVTPS